MADLADTIQKISIFSSLTREDIAKVLGRLEEVSYRAGTTIIKQGDEGDAFFLIHSGAACLTAASWSRVYGANEKLRVAAVGIAGKGWSYHTNIAASPNIA